VGETSVMVLTVLRADSPHLITVRFAMPASSEMRSARDEALRYIRVSYPNWKAGGAELTSDNNYSLHEGSSIGAALATMVLSLIKGFDIDPKVAITGDVTATGRVIKIGGVYTKFHGAETSKCTIVALPAENFDQMVNTESFIGKGEVPQIQVIGVSTIDDAVAVVRANRAEKLQRAIDLYGHVQKEIDQNHGYLHDPKCAEELKQVLLLCPQHFSAKLELMLATNKQPKLLSPVSSIYYTFNAVRRMVPVLIERKDLGRNAVPSSAMRRGLEALAKLRPEVDPSVLPLIDTWTRFIQTLQSYESGVATEQDLDRDARTVDDEMTKRNIDTDRMRKILKDGI
jgi:hypothetical protein